MVVDPCAGHSARPLAAPLAIQLFLPSSLSTYLYDVGLGAEPIGNPLNFLLFAIFFPSLVAGPIKRFENFLPNLKAGLETRFQRRGS